MKTHDLTQGSPEWHAYRAEHFNASDAPAMMGCHPTKTRSELLKEKHLGVAREFSDFVQERVLDPGHRFEALARPLAEQIIGEDLYPVVGSLGTYSASYDGLNMAETTAFEHKSLNDELRATLPATEAQAVIAVELPLAYRVQMEQQLMISGAERVLFMASKWNGSELIEERHCWYLPDLELRARIVAGWEQFAADLAVYVPPVAVDPTPAGKAPETLPALRIEVTGMVTASNLAEFKETALAAIHGVNRELSTDVDFANAESAVRWCGDVESRLAAAKEHALSQTASIDLLFKTMDDISAEARRVRLDLEKLVTARKQSIRGEIVAGGVAALRTHIEALNTRIGRPLMPTIPADFAGAIKGKRTVASLQDAVDGELAAAKISANAIADRITINLRTLDEHKAHASLFPDSAMLALKAPDDLAAAISSRLAKYKADEDQRLDAERERIRGEEQAKLQREAATQVVAAATAPNPAPVAVPATAPAPAVVRFTRPAPAPVANEPATLKLGSICERLGFTVTAAFVADTLGIQPAATDKAAKLYRESQFNAICTALVQHINAICEPQAA